MNGLEVVIDWDDFDNDGFRRISIKVQDFYGEIVMSGNPEDDIKEINSVVMGEFAEYLAEDIAHFTGLCDCGWYDYQPREEQDEDDDH